MTDWTVIKTEYITSNISQVAIAKKYNVPYYTLRTEANKNRWSEERKKYRDKVVKKGTDMACDLQARELAKLIKASGLLDDAINDNLKIIQNAQDVRSLSAALKDAISIKRNLFNLPTEAELEARKIARERLELEKRKADSEANVDTSINITFDDPEHKEWSE